MVCQQSDNKPLSEPMMAQLTDGYVCHLALMA